MSYDKSFLSPPEAPVVEPTEEEFKHPIAFLSSLRPLIMKHGICKIKPPSSWKPPFCIDFDKFHFKPRLQQINELEAQTRVKLEFLDRLAKFWELQGQSFKVPMVERKPLDLSSVFKTVVAEGGFEEVSKSRKWRAIARKLNVENAVSAVKYHYEKLLYPYERFLCKENKINTPSSTPPPRLPSRPKSAREGTPSSGRSTSRSRSSSPLNKEGLRSNSSSPASFRRSRRLSTEKEDMSGVDLQSASKELQKLQFSAPGPKTLISGITLKPPSHNNSVLAAAKRRRSKLDLDPDFKMNTEDASSPHSKRRFSPRNSPFVSPAKSIAGRTSGQLEACQTCEGNSHQEEMLLCCVCHAAFHAFCLDPPWENMPTNDWRCTQCIAEEYNKPGEAYGFEQAKKNYSLREYAAMANKFKEEYFSMPLNEISCSLVEQEYWTVVSELDSGIIVEYGADLHTSKHGSGFPCSGKTRIEEDEYYSGAGWNLNNLPVLEGSILKHIKVDISGMKIPWVYAGMCFSSFCWHTEDHWMYSINYLHTGEPKTWYGVPSSYAEALEETMREAAPELFEDQPDLMHHLVTILSPNELMKNNIPVVRTDQCCGEFIITGPRAYHAGFNQGFNVAEAVNFALPDWLPFGRGSVAHYSKMKRPPVFSHDELMCSISQNTENVSTPILKACYQDLKEMVKIEEEHLMLAAKMGVVDLAAFERFHLENQPDRDRECTYCKTYCYLSAFKCSCMQSEADFSCLSHLQDHSSCPTSGIKIKYRHTLGELRSMVEKLHQLVNPMKEWEERVIQQLKRLGETNEKQDLSQFKALLDDGRKIMANNDYESEVVQQLGSIIDEAEMCERIAVHLISFTNSKSNSDRPYLKFNEVKTVVSKVEKSPCKVEHGEELISRFEKMAELQLRLAIEKEIAQRMLGMCDSSTSNSTDVLIEEYEACGVVIPEGELLKGIKSLKNWCSAGQHFKSAKDGERYSLEEAKEHLSKGEELKQSGIVSPKMVDKYAAVQRSSIQLATELSSKAKNILEKKDWTNLERQQEISTEYSICPFYLKEAEKVDKIYQQVSTWVKKYLSFNDTDQKYLTVADLKELISGGSALPVELQEVTLLKEKLQKVELWMQKAKKMFLKDDSSVSLLEILLPRSSPTNAVFKKLLPDGSSGEKSYTFVQVLQRIANPEKAVKMMKDRESRELPFYESLRKEKSVLSQDEIGKCYYCATKQDQQNIIQCQLCLLRAHQLCVKIKRGIRSPEFLYADFFLCPECVRSLRPSLEAAEQLCKEGQLLQTYLPELCAIDCMVKRAKAWQNRVMIALTKIKNARESKQQGSEKVSHPSSDGPTSNCNKTNSLQFCTVATQTDPTNEELGTAAPSNKEKTDPDNADPVAMDTIQSPDAPLLLSKSKHSQLNCSSVTSSAAQCHLEDTPPATPTSPLCETSPPYLLTSRMLQEVFYLRLEGAAIELKLDGIQKLVTLLKEEEALENVDKVQMEKGKDIKRFNNHHVKDETSLECIITKVETASGKLSYSTEVADPPTPVTSTVPAIPIIQTISTGRGRDGSDGSPKRTVLHAQTPASTSYQYVSNQQLSRLRNTYTHPVIRGTPIAQQQVQLQFQESQSLIPTYYRSSTVEPTTLSPTISPGQQVVIMRQIPRSTLVDPKATTNRLHRTLPLYSPTQTPACISSAASIVSPVSQPQIIISQNTPCVVEQRPVSKRSPVDGGIPASKRMKRPLGAGSFDLMQFPSDTQPIAAVTSQSDLQIRRQQSETIHKQVFHHFSPS